jgi:molybdopterin converting factor small subunit
VPQVEVAPPYRAPTKGEGRIQVEGRTVRECIEAVETRYPGFRELVLDANGELDRLLLLFVNGHEHARDALETPVSGDDSVEIRAVVAGG